MNPCAKFHAFITLRAILTPTAMTTTFHGVFTDIISLDPLLMRTQDQSDTHIYILIYSDSNCRRRSSWKMKTDRTIPCLKFNTTDVGDPIIEDLHANSNFRRIILYAAILGV